MTNEQSAEQHKPEESQAHEEPAAEASVATSEAGESSTAETPEAAAPATSAQDEQAEVAELQQALEEARAQADDYWNRLVRSEAEKENVRKRAQKDVDTARKQALEKLAGELLSVRDSLEMGVDAAHQEDADVEKIREGTELTLRMLVQAMEKFQIEEIDPVGEKFNPDLHQAMSMQEVEGYEPNTVISVMQKGYRMEDRLLRPALVMVAK